MYENDFIFSPYGTGWHIDRQRFDAMLALAAEEIGAMVLRGTKTVSLSFNGDRWKVLVKGNGTELEAEAPFSVDATGRAAWFARSQGSRELVYDQMIGVIGILLPQSSRISTHPILMLEAVEEGWWYSVPLPDGSLLVTYMTDHDYLACNHGRHKTFWNNHLERTTHTAVRTRGFRLVGEVRVRVANTCRLDKVAGLGWIAVGDAACVYDPLSAIGLTKALKSGLNAAKSINDYLAGNHTELDNYAAKIANEFEDYLEQRTQYYRREGRWPHSLFWNRRQMIAPKVLINA